MTSNNRTVNKCIDLLVNQREKLLGKYISGMYDLIEIIEARDGTVL